MKPIVTLRLYANGSEYETESWALVLCKAFVKIAIGKTPRRILVRIYNEYVPGGIKVGITRNKPARSGDLGLRHDVEQIRATEIIVRGYMFTYLQDAIIPYVKTCGKTFFWVKITRIHKK